MSARITISLESSFYDDFSDTSTLSPTITERQAAVVSSALSVLMLRDVWEPMSDPEWDDWEALIAEIEGIFS